MRKERHAETGTTGVDHFLVAVGGVRTDGIRSGRRAGSRRHATRGPV